MSLLHILLSILSLVSSPDTADSGDSNTELEGLIQTTLANHPTVEAARAKLEMAEARIPQAKGWPDPVISGGANNYPFALNPLNISRFPMTATRIGVTQRIPKPGTLRLKEEIASQKYRIAETEIEQVQLELSMGVQKLYVRLSHLKKKRAELESIVSLLDQLEAVVESKYESGMIPLSSVLRVQNQKESIQTQIYSLDERFAEGLANLYWFTGIEYQEDQLLFSSSSEIESDSVDELVELAMKKRPDIARQRKNINLNDFEIELAEKDLAPDISLNVSFGYRWDMTDLWSANVAITLPLHRDDRERQRIVEKEAERRMNRLQLLAMERRIRSEIRSNSIKKDQIDKQIRHIEEEYLPSIVVTTEATYSRFESDLAPITDILELYISQAQAKLQVISLQEDRALTAVTIAYLTGRTTASKEAQR